MKEPNAELKYKKKRKHKPFICSLMLLFFLAVLNYLIHVELSDVYIGCNQSCNEETYFITY